MWQIRHFKTVTYISGRSQMKLKYSKAKTEQQFWSRGNSELFKNVLITCNEALQLKSHGPWRSSLGKLFCTESGCTVSSVTVCSLRSSSIKIYILKPRVVAMACNREIINTYSSCVERVER